MMTFPGHDAGPRGTTIENDFLSTLSVMSSRLAGTNFYACSSRGRIRLQADVIVNRIAKTLLAAQVSLRRLN
jgi:hypothetical protein